jgi:hypothetical protein
MPVNFFASLTNFIVIFCSVWLVCTCIVIATWFLLLFINGK